MRRPMRSASQPEVMAPTRRSHNVTDSTKATSVRGTPNSFEIGTMISRNMVKSNASRVQPIQPATQASHWSLVGSRYQGIGAEPAVVLIVKSLLRFLGGTIDYRMTARHGRRAGAAAKHRCRLRYERGIAPYGVTCPYGTLRGLRTPGRPRALRPRTRILASPPGGCKAALRQARSQAAAIV